MKQIISALLVAVTFTFYGCPGEAPTPTGPQANPYANESFYFLATLDSDQGGTKVFNNDLIDLKSQIGYASAAGAASKTGLIEQSMVLVRPSNSNFSAGVSILKSSASPGNLCSQVEPMFGVQSYAYGNRLNKTDGVVVYFIDQNGREWASDRGLAMQDSTAYFNVTNHTPNTDDTFSKYISTASFECRLYDEAGRSVKLSNGTLRSRSVRCTQQ